MSVSTSQRAKAQALRLLHRGEEPLVLANVWDVASARLVAAAGAEAVATSSAGVAWSLGYPDGARIGRDEMLATVARIAAGVEVPVTADLENGYGADPQAVMTTVESLIAAGGVGLNLEDSDAETGHEVWELARAADRIRAARDAAKSAGVDVVINARTDVFFPANTAIEDPLAEAIRRGNAYLEAGADCVFTPFVVNTEVIRSLVEGIDGPLNVLIAPPSPTVAELRALGVRRVSVGGAFSGMVYGAVRRAAEELLASGTYGFMSGSIPHPEMNALFED